MAFAAHRFVPMTVVLDGYATYSQSEKIKPEIRRYPHTPRITPGILFFKALQKNRLPKQT